MKITSRLYELKDDSYAQLQSKIVPNIDSNRVIGVRVPIVRTLAKEYIKEPESNIFLETLPHKYYDEDMLHSLLISEIKDYDECINKLNKFLPYIDNWAVCDILSPKVFKKNKDKLINEIKKWTKSKKVYICRFGIEMLMSHYLDNDYKKEYLDIPNINSDEYYINMMIAWFYATSLAKRWDDTIKYLEDNKLNKWVHNKTIQKAVESYRITNEQKEYLRSLKIK